MTGCGAVSHIKRDKMRIDNTCGAPFNPQRRQHHHTIGDNPARRRLCRQTASPSSPSPVAANPCARPNSTGAIISATRGSICACIFHLASKGAAVSRQCRNGLDSTGTGASNGSTAFPSPPQPARGRSHQGRGRHGRPNQLPPCRGVSYKCVCYSSG